jgi:hypothetical protein
MTTDELFARVRRLDHLYLTSLAAFDASVGARGANKLRLKRKSQRAWRAYVKLRDAAK